MFQLLILNLLGQAELPIDIGTLMNLVFLILFLMFIVWGQRIQIYIIMKDIEFVLRRVDLMKDEGRKMSLEKLKKHSAVPDPSAFLDRMLDYVVIEPVSMDPSGVVWKLDHLLKTAEDRIKGEIKEVASRAGDSERENISNLLEVAATLNLLYRILRHYYIMGKKTGNQIIIIQLQALLPEIMMQADALMGALYAYTYGHPIGDGAGALVAANLGYPNEFKNTGRDMEVCETEVEGRKVTVLKSRGPGATVGYPGDATQEVIKKRKFDLIIMVDAGLKLEGEKSGTVFEGIGAAIGGIGTEKFKIEEAVARKKSKLYGVIIRMSLKEAITPLTEEVLKGVETATARVREVIKEKVPEKGKVLVIGVGNTVGVR